MRRPSRSPASGSTRGGEVRHPRRKRRGAAHRARPRRGHRAPKAAGSWLDLPDRRPGSDGGAHAADRAARDPRVAARRRRPPRHRHARRGARLPRPHHPDPDHRPRQAARAARAQPDGPRRARSPRLAALVGGLLGGCRRPRHRPRRAGTQCRHDPQRLVVGRLGQLLASARPAPPCAASAAACTGLVDALERELARFDVDDRARRRGHESRARCGRPASADARPSARPPRMARAPRRPRPASCSCRAPTSCSPPRATRPSPSSTTALDGWTHTSDSESGAWPRRGIRRTRHPRARRARPRCRSARHRRARRRRRARGDGEGPHPLDGEVVVARRAGGRPPRRAPLVRTRRRARIRSTGAPMPRSPSSRSPTPRCCSASTSTSGCSAPRAAPCGATPSRRRPSASASGCTLWRTRSPLNPESRRPDPGSPAPDSPRSCRTRSRPHVASGTAGCSLKPTHSRNGIFSSQPPCAASMRGLRLKRRCGEPQGEMGCT